MNRNTEEKLVKVKIRVPGKTEECEGTAEGTLGGS